MPMSASIVDIDVLNDEVIDVVDNISNAETQTGDVASCVCSVCGSAITENTYECPGCGVIIKKAPKRKHKPDRELIRTVESNNYNGEYRVYRLSDGTPFCDCLSFLFQRGTVEENGVITCKHIRSTGVTFSSSSFKKVTDWQRTLLKKLGVTINDKLSAEQAYWIVSDLLKKMGVDYHNFISLLKSNPSYELLPLYSFGVELEGLIRNREQLNRKLQENNIRSILTGYSHAMQNRTWKVGDDGSVRRNNTETDYESMELTSPKLFGCEGFNEIKKALSTWREIGGAVNSFCGFHVHIDAWNYSRDDIKRLSLVWAKIEPVVYYLVSKSRRNNSYCIWLRKSPETVSRIVDPFNERIDINRYRALNLDAFNRYKTVEFRIHQGTMNVDKVINWVIFCLKLMQKVKEGLKHTSFSDSLTIEEVLDRIGIVKNSIPIIRNCREFLIARYYAFKRAESDREPNIPDYYGFLGEIKEFIRTRVNEVFRSRFGMGSVVYSHSGLPDNHVRNLASLLPSRRLSISYDEVSQLLRESRDGTIRFPSLSSDSSGTYQVRYDAESETLTCSCRTFRIHNHCIHSMATARAICLTQMLRNFETFDF